ncbi:hypothetical protein HYV83_05070 [Candidatus Woesearchaeota archaeon]|nr:hypothetical protein [Candidatus Woesearchaeota archaeon]
MGKRRMKKAQGLTLNTIVIAALVLVVLLIALAILGRTSGKTLPFFDKQTGCEARGGNCAPETGLKACTGTKIYGLDCTDPTPVCCIKEQVA